MSRRKIFSHAKACLLVNLVAGLAIMTGVVLLRYDSAASSLTDQTFSHYVMDHLALSQQTVETEKGEITAQDWRHLQIETSDEAIRVTQGDGPYLRYRVTQTQPKHAPLSTSRTAISQQGDRLIIRLGEDKQGKDAMNRPYGGRMERLGERWGRILDEGRTVLFISLPSPHQGEISLKSRDGDIDINIPRLASPITAQSSTGDVILHFREGDASYILRSTTGDIKAPINTYADENPGPEAVIIKGRLGDGTFPLHLNSTSGDVVLIQQDRLEE